MPAPLITAAQVAAAVPGATPDQIAGLEATASAIAEAHCCRPLALRTFDDELRPDLDGVVRLRTWPVVEVDGVFCSPRAVLTLAPVPVPGLWRDSVRLRFDGPDPTTPSGVALTTTVGGLPSVTDLSFAPAGGSPLATVGGLAAAINATGTWTAEVPGDFAACPTAELRALQAGGAGLGSRRSLVAWTGQVAAFDHDPRIGRLRLGLGWCDSGWPGLAWGGGGIFEAATVRVRYAAGFNGDPAAGPITVPPDLAEACCQLARNLVNVRKANLVVKQVGLGNTSFTLADQAQALTPEVAAQLSRYVDRRF